MEHSRKLTEDEIESLAIYLDCFKSAFYLQTYVKLETTDQIIDEVLKGTFTMEDVFMTHLDSAFRHEDREIEYTWEDNMEMFDYENFYPSTCGKKLENGAWIKIRNENGYEIHFAKYSNRKRRFQEEITKLHNQTISYLKKQTRILTKGSKADLNMDKKIKEIKDKIAILTVYATIGIKPYEVVIKRSKHKSEYYMPYQYEIVDDLDEHIQYAIGNVPGVEVKAMRDGDVEDKVFYLRSRGISENTARLMASLNQTYFRVNMNTVMDKYNEQFANVKLVMV